ncbi:alpha/beta fold hydrolase [Tsukamurella sp. 8F]|uniref:alpha/beta hydrolase family protein n=1 Tax=unclassified Tsukamurella TaxID=2633480 RepID=UPI0023B8F8F5|nr:MULTISPECIES: alpha/beta fold hydrolase [unclassified Tsukamurella]MDF0529500.1 alpha/beta fold hydrolase [Tsukamurella sp. 8J]MDF0585812.1 alpha/beta fold hydrolase [Tsukamurella sp. 8F]
MTAAGTVEKIALSADDGTEFTVRLLPGDPGTPIVLVLPAMGMKAKHYLPVAEALAATGLNAAVCDLRGQGDSRPILAEADDFGYREMLEVDLPAIVGTLRDRFEGVPLYLFGHSLGGQLSLLYAASHPDEIAGIAVIGTGTVYWRAFDLLRRPIILAQTQWIGAVSRLTGRWPGGVAIPAPMAGGVMIDWSLQALTGRYVVRDGTRRYNDLLARMDRPVLAISLADDSLGPKSTVEYLLRRMPVAAISHWHLSGAAPVRAGDHFAWLKDSPALAVQVTAWVRAADGAGREERGTNGS